MTKLYKVLSIFLMIVIVAVLSGIGYMLVTPKQGDKFSEFYILGPDGKATGYPEETTVGKPIQLLMGIINHEHQTMDYRVEIRIRDETINQLTISSLDDGQKWEQVISFTSEIPGEKQKVEFYLYRNDESQPYFKDPLRLYIDFL